MELAAAAAESVVVIIIYTVIGFFAAKMGLLTKEVSDGATKVMVFICCPALAMSAFFRDFDSELIKGLLISVLLSLLYFAFGIIFGKIFVRESNPNKAVARVCMVYENFGFIGLPLVSMILGPEGVVYGAIHLAVFQFVFFTHGVITLSGNFDRSKLKNCFLNPSVICAVIGLLIFVLRISLPELIKTPITQTGNCATPLGMIIAGGIIARSDMRPVIKSTMTYVVTAVKLIVLPMIIIGIGKAFSINEYIAVTAIIAAACPQANFCNVFSEMYGKNSALASGIFSLDTLLCIFTIPMMVALYGIL